MERIWAWIKWLITWRETATKELIDSIASKSIAQHVYSTLIQLYSASQSSLIRSTALASLGYIFRSYPMLMLKEGSTNIMDAVFASDNAQSISQLLRILQDFLASQGKVGVAPLVAVKVEQSREMAMDELVGNVDGFADSGFVITLS
jgi:cohesin loading factor subunit SCC2